MEINTSDTGKLQSRYQSLISSGKIEFDAAQIELVSALDALLQKISDRRMASKSSALGWIFGRNRQSVEALKGLYIWGDVGRGKSMLMDMFFDLVPHKRKRRSHFNDFMQDAQERIHAHRKDFKDGKTRQEDPIPAVGKAIAAESKVLCFDEFTVTDIADAMILGRLFETLFKDGVIVVATSNVKPENLYRDGLNRKLFLPFIDVLQKNVSVIRLEARTDFRLEKLNKAPVYHHPLNEQTSKAMQSIWQRMTGTEKGNPVSIPLRGRNLCITEFKGGIARMSFDALCREPRSAEDYLALARQVHTLLLTDVPQIDRENRNLAKRFILLIDTLYDNHVRTILSAAGAPKDLYAATAGTEAFEFKRTVSRLHEMQSHEYLGSG